VTATLSGPMLPPRSGGAPKQLMVLLHGYGADGRDLISLGYEWGELFPDMLFVSPNAPSPCGAGGPGYEWFAIDWERRDLARQVGLPLAAPVLVNFLIDLWAQTGVGPSQTVLVGFSQGAMLALHVGTALDQPLAGIVAFSGAFSPAEGFETGRFAKPPVALIHGAADQVVDPMGSRDAAEVLAAHGFDVGLHISPGVAHGIAPDGLDFATSFLIGRFGGNR
jgi:phospholipase/carboxylesterase